MRCRGCNAPLPLGIVSCHYCGVSNDRDLVGKHYFTVQLPDHIRLCPCCKIAMQTLNLGKTDNPFYVERCQECMGLFFDPGELDSLVADIQKNAYTIDALQLRALRESRREEETVVYRPCPVCEKLMNRRVFQDRSGVIIDQCRDHGIWLNGGELGMILNWVKAGGEILAKQAREQEESANHRRQLAKSRDKLEAENNPIFRTDKKWQENSGTELLSEAINQVLSQIFGSKAQN